MEPDPKIVDAAREKMRGLFNRMSFAERWHPIAQELMWVLIGKPDQAKHNKPLPDYCYSILELFHRTIFKGLSNPNEVFGPAAGNTGGKVDWEKLGITIGIGLRGIQFSKQEVEGEVESLHLETMADAEAEEIGNMLVSDKFIELLAKELSIEPSLAALERKAESGFNQLEENIRHGVPHLDEKAFEAGPEALHAFKVGSGKGIDAFLTPDGELRGEGSLKMANTYWVLLFTWSEIEEMLCAEPPKRMEDLWDWLSPLSYAGWVEIQDLDQLVSLCRPLKLKLKKPGAPRGPRKKC